MKQQSLNCLKQALYDEGMSIITAGFTMRVGPVIVSGEAN